MYKNFDTPQQMVNWLMENEGLELGDGFGRRWKYENYKFYFQDISKDTYSEKVSCLHLYRTAIPIKY